MYNKHEGFYAFNLSCLHSWMQPQEKSEKCKDLVGSCSASPPLWRSAPPKISVLTGTASRFHLALTLALTLGLALTLDLLALLPTPAVMISCASVRSV